MSFKEGKGLWMIRCAVLTTLWSFSCSASIKFENPSLHLKKRFYLWLYSGTKSAQDWNTEYYFHLTNSGKFHHSEHHVNKSGLLFLFFLEFVWHSLKKMYLWKFDTINFSPCNYFHKRYHGSKWEGHAKPNLNPVVHLSSYIVLMTLYSVGACMRVSEGASERIYSGVDVLCYHCLMLTPEGSNEDSITVAWCCLQPSATHTLSLAHK